MENRYAGKGTRLGVAATGVIVAAIGLASVISDASVAPMPPSTPDTIIEAQPPAAIPIAESVGTITPVADATPSAGEKAQSELKDLVKAWRDAWASQDSTAYLAFYAADFQGKAGTPEQWRADRKRIIGQAKFIEIQLGQADIKLDGDAQATITFPLDYASDRFEDHGTKVLEVRRKDGQWLIEGEAFTVD